MKAIILTTGIHAVFRGLKFEPDAEIGQKGAFYKGLLFPEAALLILAAAAAGTGIVAAGFRVCRCLLNLFRR